MMVSFVDLKQQLDYFANDFRQAFDNVLTGKWLILGEHLESFEQNFAAYCGVKHVVGVGTGLDALAIALRARGIGAGDEVIVPGHTFIATWLAVSQVGAKIVPVDIELETGNMDANQIEGHISERTRAIIPVHLYGRPANMAAILEIAQKYGLFVLEDGAQAHGAQIGGKRIGAIGDATAFSFYPTKNLGCLGDGGAVATDDDDLAAMMRRYRNYGSERKYYHQMRGTNSRLDDVQAAFLNVQLPHLDEMNEKRQMLAARYSRELAPTELVLPGAESGAPSVYHLYVVRHDRRDELAQYLAQKGIQTAIHYPVVPSLQDAYAQEFGAVCLPNSVQYASTCLSLPLWPMMSLESQDEVVTQIINFFA